MYKFMKWITQRKVLATIAQIILALMVLFIAAFFLKLFAPEQAGNFYSNVFSEVPILGKVVDLVYAYFTTDGSTYAGLTTYSALMNYVGDGVFETFMIAYTLLIFNQLHKLIGWNGCPVLATVFGVGAGCAVIWLLKSADMLYKIMIIFFLITLLVVLIILNNSLLKKGLPATPARIFWAVFAHVMAAGYQAILAGYTMFFSSCVFVAFDGRLTDFRGFLIYVFIPFLVWILFIIVEALIDFAIDPK